MCAMVNQTFESNREKTVPSAETCSKKAIVLLPGLMGSSLYAEESFEVPMNGAPEGCGKGFRIRKGLRVWDPSTRLFRQEERFTVADEKVMSLRCGPDGNPAYPVGVRSPIVNGILEHGRRYGANGIYRTVYLHLLEEFRPDYDVVLFEYDWREDPAESAKKLDAFVKKSGYRELILVAHSMGGLVASQFLALGEDQVRSVRKLIGFGIPFLGTEKAADVFFSGDALDVKYFGIDVADLLLAGCFRSVMTNFASVYALLPGKTHFRPFLRYSDGEGAGRIPASYEETYGVFAAAVPGWNAGLFRSAQDNCEHLFTYNRHIAESVPTYLVVGTGIDTPSLLHIRKDASGAYSETVEYRTPDGDGYVGTRSSMPEGLPGNPDRLLVKNPPKDIYAGHIPMVEFASQDRGIALKFLDRAIKE